MKQKYQEYNPQPETLKLIQFMNGLIASYQAQGFVLSVRQLYYQLVARDKIPNTDRSYKRIASILNYARLGGLVDWDAIEDRNRDIVVRNHWDSAASIIRASATQYHMDLWEPQNSRVLVIVEKAALAGVLGGVCREYDVPLLAARGYPSVSIVREMVRDHFFPAARADQTIVVLHFGDHDPSGLDMTRDLRERIELFAEGRFDVEVRRLALNMEQIEEKNPPPNPAKVSDSRFNGYEEQFGSESWELDALEPQYLVDLVKSEIETFIDQDRWQERQDQIDDVKLRLSETADEYERDE